MMTLTEIKKSRVQKNQFSFHVVVVVVVVVALLLVVVRLVDMIIYTCHTHFLGKLEFFSITKTRHLKTQIINIYEKNSIKFVNQ
jgi:hypothetical protein